MAAFQNPTAGRHMSKKLIVVAIVAALTAAVAPTATGAATKTKVNISTYGFDGPGGQFQIEVKSSEKACKKKRKVTLYRGGAGDDVKIGAEKTISGEGTYVAIIDDPNPPTPDAYYASVKKENGCAADKSKDFFILFR